MENVYIVTKPLQYINACNISDEIGGGTLLLVDSFINASLLYEEISKLKKWNSVHIFKSRNYALFWLIFHKKSFDRLLIDSDSGVILSFLFLCLQPIRIYTYEEGYGSYCSFENELSQSYKLKIRKWIYRKIFCSELYIGGNYFTNGTYLYAPPLMIKNIPNCDCRKIFLIRKRFSENIFQYQELRVLMGDFKVISYKDKNILLYLTSWEVNEKYKLYIREFGHYVKMLKSHPHLKTGMDIKNDFDIDLDGGCPAELYILILKEFCKQMIVLHDNSSTYMYLSNDEKVSFINLADKPVDDIYNFFQKNN